MKTNKAGARGFTLIELLVVIAIIGILSAVVLTSLNSARVKARDARRVSDISQMQLALELDYDKNGAYPAAFSTVVTDGFIAAQPSDPTGGTAAYGYVKTTTGYVVGAIMETAGQSAALSTDYDGDTTANPITINGAVHNCNELAGLATEVVYCKTP
jgi:prepilin-type N-terminal cleavage/methylation domain-containing protein